MRKLLFLCVIACCTLLVRAQNNAAGHPHFDVKFDDLSRTNHKGFADVTALTAAQSAIWSPRGVTNVGEMRRWCIHEIFNYMESQLSFKSVVLEYKITSSFNVNSRDAAAALYYYKLSDLSKSEVIRTMPQLHYLTGQDPDQTVPDAVLEFNMLLDWECDTKAQPIAGRDLFTCGLHELLHSLGISSLMGISASSTPVSLGNNMANGPYSEFDNMLYLDNSSGTKVLNYTVGVGTTINASAANLCNNIVVFKFGSISYLLPVYSPEHYEPGSSFSHVDESRMENEPEIAMVHGLAPNQRVPGLHDFEKLILCQLGYILNGDVFTPPYGCTPFPVGINDNPSAVWDCQATTSMTYEVIDNDLKVGNNNLVIDPAFGNAGVELLNDITGIQVSIQKTTITVTKTQSIIFPSRKLKIKYRPLDAVTGRPGSEAILTIITSNNGLADDPDNPCNLILNAGFERGISLADFECKSQYNEIDRGFCDNWDGKSTDLYVRGSGKGLQNGNVTAGIPINWVTSNGETMTKGGNRYAGMFTRRDPSGSGPNDGEMLIATLAKPTDGISTYTFTANMFYTQQNDPNATFTAAIYVCKSYSRNTGSLTVNFTGLQQVGTIVANGTGTWLTSTINFTCAPGAQYLVISAMNNPCPNPGPCAWTNINGYCFFDNVQLTGDGANIEVSKTVDNPNPSVGDIITYTISFTNKGNKDVIVQDVKDVLAGGLEFVSAAPVGDISCDPNTGSYFFKPFTLLQNATKTFTTQCRIRNMLLNYCSTLTNCVELVAMKNLYSLTAISNQCFPSKACADVVVQNNPANCACKLTDFPVQVIRTCRAKEIIAINPNLLTGDIHDYMFSLDNGDWFTADNTILNYIGPLTPGAHTIAIRKKTANGVGCPFGTFSYLIIQEYTQTIASESVLQKCGLSIPLSSLSLNNRMRPGAVLTWYDENGNPIQSTSQISQKATITGKISYANGCELFVQKFFISFDCCESPDNFHSFHKQYRLNEIDIQTHAKNGININSIETVASITGNNQHSFVLSKLFRDNQNTPTTHLTELDEIGTEVATRMYTPNSLTFDPVAMTESGFRQNGMIITGNSAGGISVFEINPASNALPLSPDNAHSILMTVDGEVLTATAIVQTTDIVGSSPVVSGYVILANSVVTNTNDKKLYLIGISADFSTRWITQIESGNSCPYGFNLIGISDQAGATKGMAVLASRNSVGQVSGTGIYVPVTSNGTITAAISEYESDALYVGGYQQPWTSGSSGLILTGRSTPAAFTENTELVVAKLHEEMSSTVSSRKLRFYNLQGIDIQPAGNGFAVLCQSRQIEGSDQVYNHALKLDGNFNPSGPGFATNTHTNLEHTEVVYGKSQMCRLRTTAAGGFVYAEANHPGHTMVLHRTDNLFSQECDAETKAFEMASGYPVEFSRVPSSAYGNLVVQNLSFGDFNSYLTSECCDKIPTSPFDHCKFYRRPTFDVEVEQRMDNSGRYFKVKATSEQTGPSNQLKDARWIDYQQPGQVKSGLSTTYVLPDAIATSYDLNLIVTFNNGCTAEKLIENTLHINHCVQKTVETFETIYSCNGSKLQQTLSAAEIARINQEGPLQTPYTVKVRLASTLEEVNPGSDGYTLPEGEYLLEVNDGSPCLRYLRHLTVKAAPQNVVRTICLDPASNNTIYLSPCDLFGVPVVRYKGVLAAGYPEYDSDIGYNGLIGCVISHPFTAGTYQITGYTSNGCQIQLTLNIVNGASRNLLCQRFMELPCSGLEAIPMNLDQYLPHCPDCEVIPGSSFITENFQMQNDPATGDLVMSKYVFNHMTCTKCVKEIRFRKIIGLNNGDPFIVNLNYNADNNETSCRSIDVKTLFVNGCAGALNTPVTYVAEDASGSVVETGTLGATGFFRFCCNAATGAGARTYKFYQRLPNGCYCMQTFVVNCVELHGPEIEPLHSEASSDLPPASYTLYPNPGSDLIVISRSGIQPESETLAEVKIFDLTGKQVMKISAYSISTPVSISDLAAGCYLITLQSGSETFKWKFIKL